MKINACILSVLTLISIFTAEAATQISAISPTHVSSTKALKSLLVTGSVISVDMVGNTINIEGKKKTQWVFSVPASAKILEGKKNIVLGDILTGFKVAVKYTKDGDTLSATSIQVLTVKKASQKVTVK